MPEEKPLQLSLSAHAFSFLSYFDAAIEPALEFAKRAGFDGVEIEETVITRWMGGKRLKAISQYYEVPIRSVHQSLGRIAFSTRHSIENLARRSAEIGAELVVVHAASTKRSFANHEFYRSLRDMGKKFGVVMSFENSMAQLRAMKTNARSAFHEPDGFARGIQYNNLPMTYDPAHMGALNTDLISYFERLRDHIVNIHVHDYWQGVDHMALGKGDLPWAEFLKHLQRVGYRGLLTLEVYPFNTRPWLKRKQVEKILEQSLAFFREHTSASGA